MARTANGSKKEVIEETTPLEAVAYNTLIEETTPLSMEEKITLKNLANWMVGFPKIESMGEVNINPRGSIRVTRGEVITQFENGNKLLRGDGDGSHATIFIDDKATRDYLDIDTEILDKAKVKKIFEIKGLDDFRNEIHKTFKTKTEQILLINSIRECGFNDFNKIRECEVYTGMTV